MPNEVEKLKERHYQPYSEGHRKMYTVPIDLLSGQQKHSILDVGFGIGFGLSEMIKCDCFTSYTGLEPDIETYQFVKNNSLYGHQNINLINQSLLLYEGLIQDYVFCIEVIEHIEEKDLDIFIRKLSNNTGKCMFLSTPDIRDSPHGIKTSLEWRELLFAGFSDVVFVRSQWTTLFVCQP